jgi:hypothetical protein
MVNNQSYPRFLDLPAIVFTESANFRAFVFHNKSLFREFTALFSLGLALKGKNAGNLSFNINYVYNSQKLTILSLWILNFS